MHIVHCTALPHLHFVVGKVRKVESRSVQICKLLCVVLCRAFPYLHFGKKGGGTICADLPARMVGERPNGAQRRLLGHADVPSCGTPMLSDRCSLNIRKKAISVHFCSLSLSLEISRGMNSLLNTPSWPQLPGLPRALNMDFFSQLVGRPTSDPPLRWPGARKSETGGGEARGN